MAAPKHIIDLDRPSFPEDPPTAGPALQPRTVPPVLGTPSIPAAPDVGSVEPLFPDDCPPALPSALRNNVRTPRLPSTTAFWVAVAACVCVIVALAISLAVTLESKQKTTRKAEADTRALTQQLAGLQASLGQARSAEFKLQRLQRDNASLQERLSKAQAEITSVRQDYERSLHSSGPNPSAAQTASQLSSAAARPQPAASSARPRNSGAPSEGSKDGVPGGAEAAPAVSADSFPSRPRRSDDSTVACAPPAKSAVTPRPKPSPAYDPARDTRQPYVVTPVGPLETPASCPDSDITQAGAALLAATREALQEADRSGYLDKTAQNSLRALTKTSQDAMQAQALAKTSQDAMQGVAYAIGAQSVLGRPRQVPAAALDTWRCMRAALEELSNKQTIANVQTVRQAACSCAASLQDCKNKYGELKNQADEWSNRISELDDSTSASYTAKRELRAVKEKMNLYDGDLASIQAAQNVINACDAFARALPRFGQLSSNLSVPKERRYLSGCSWKAALAAITTFKDTDGVLAARARAVDQAKDAFEKAARGPTRN